MRYARHDHRQLSIRATNVLAFVAVSLLAACAPMHRAPDPNEALLVFDNESPEQATVYVVDPGSDMVRVGTVMALRTDTLRIPSTITGRASNVNIVARLLARPDVPQTGPIAISPGSILSVRLPSDARVLLVTGSGHR